MEISVRPGLSLASRWPLLWDFDEEEHFICSVFTRKSHSIGQRLLLAILMTTKFDMRPLTRAAWSVALSHSPERLTTTSCSFD